MIRLPKLLACVAALLALRSPAAAPAEDAGYIGQGQPLAAIMQPALVPPGSPSAEIIALAGQALGLERIELRPRATRPVFSAARTTRVAPELARVTPELFARTLIRLHESSDGIKPLLSSGQTSRAATEFAPVKPEVFTRTLIALVKLHESGEAIKPLLALRPTTPATAPLTVVLAARQLERAHLEVTGSYEIRAPDTGKVYTADILHIQDDSAEHPIRGEWLALSDQQLDQMRGGFETPSGLNISFGIERAVYINGNLVTTTTFNVGDLGKLTGQQAEAAGVLIQNGAGNSFQPGAIPASALPTVIQNTLNNQTIQGITVINAATNSMEILKAINLQSTLNEAMVGSLRK